jgi:acetyltransferase-like isoleucine patch superfamily enzyme
MKLRRVVRGFPLLLWELIAAPIRASESRAGVELRRWLYGTDCHVDTGVHITNRRNFSCGEGCALYHQTYVLNGEGRFTMGRNSHLGAFCFVNVQRGAVELGSDVAVGPGTRIIAYSNHYEAGKTVTAVRKTADVRIGNNVLIGANCTLLPGSVIGDNVVVGAGSVVRGELAPNAIYAGVPCVSVKTGWYE